MSEASGEKRFEATAARIRKAKREGNVVRAQEFGANVALLCASGAVVALAPAFAALAAQAVRTAASGVPPFGPVMQMAGLALAPMGAAAAGGAAASLLQSGGLVISPPQLKLARLHPGEGLKRLFSRDALTHGVRALAACALAALAVIPAIRQLFAVALSGAGARAVAAVAWDGAQHVVPAIAGVGLAFAAFEFGVARAQWLKRLRMTFEEFKREMKDQDGDPLARGRRRALHRSLLRGALSDVKKAAFVVVNPTHVAVALAYRPPAVPVPVVLVRAAGEAALRVRALARERQIPVVENVALARALFAECAAGRAIPPEQYVAVAEIVRALLRAGALA